jgi:hypothetical protein
MLMFNAKAAIEETRRRLSDPPRKLSLFDRWHWRTTMPLSVWIDPMVMQIYT